MQRRKCRVEDRKHQDTPPPPPANNLGVLFPSVKYREQDVCTPYCKLCLRVWVRFAWKELLAIFSSISKSQSECALGASWRGAGASVSARSPGRRAAAPPRVGAQTFSPGFWGGQRPTTNSDVSLSRAPANPRSVQARGMGSSPTETWNPAARKRILRLGGVSAGQTHTVGRGV